MAWYGPWTQLKYAYDSFKNVTGKPELGFYLRKQSMNLNKHFVAKKPPKLGMLHHY